MDGAELQIEGEIFRYFHLQFNMSYVNGTVLSNRKPLERMPPLNGKLVFRYAQSAFHIDLASRFAASQNRLGEFEERTDGYLVHDIGGYFNFSVWQLQSMLVVELENIFNTEYREHLSLIKAVKPEPGRNVKLLYKLHF